MIRDFLLTDENSTLHDSPDYRLGRICFCRPSAQLRASAFNVLRQDSYGSTLFANEDGGTLRNSCARSNRGIRVTLENKI